jgi:hypothetical protein
LLVVRLVNPGPAVSNVALPGEESPVELVVTTFIAHDFVKRDGLQAHMMLPCERQTLMNLIESQKVITFSSEPAKQATPKRLAPGPLKVPKG